MEELKIEVFEGVKKERKPRGKNPYRKLKSKAGRPKKLWAPKWMRTETWEWIEKVLMYIQFWKKEAVGDKDYIPYTPMTLEKALAEVWKSRVAFFWNLNNHPEFKEKYELAKEARRENRKAMAENQLDKALGWLMTMEDKDLARLSLDILKATDKSYNPKIEIEETKKSLHLNISDADLQAKILELMNS